MDELTTLQIVEAGLPDWRQLSQSLHARYRIGDFNQGSAFIAAIAEAAEAANHHPDLTMTYGSVGVSLCTHDQGRRVTSKDVDLARTISDIARDLGLAAQPSTVAQLEMGLDTAHAAAIAPFWSALLTGRPGNVTGDTVFDPSSQLPPVWFQQTDEHEPPRQRWHVDLWLAPEVADERIRAALAAGGSVVDESQAPSFTVLADPDGNKACVCTSLERP